MFIRTHKLINSLNRWHWYNYNSFYGWTWCGVADSHYPIHRPFNNGDVRDLPARLSYPASRWQINTISFRLVRVPCTDSTFVRSNYSHAGAHCIGSTCDRRRSLNENETGGAHKTRYPWGETVREWNSCDNFQLKRKGSKFWNQLIISLSILMLCAFLRARAAVVRPSTSRI